MTLDEEIIKTQLEIIESYKNEIKVLKKTINDCLDYINKNNAVFGLPHIKKMEVE